VERKKSCASFKAVITMKFHVLTNGTKYNVDWLHGKIEFLFFPTTTDSSNFSFSRWFVVAFETLLPIIQFHCFRSLFFAPRNPWFYKQICFCLRATMMRTREQAASYSIFGSVLNGSRFYIKKNLDNEMRSKLEKF
jgi:hypothetical protein